MLGGLVNYLPANNLLFRACRRYVNRYVGENNADIYRNGEFFC
jgi:hypothetical protein